jgi:hypothetical protein
MLPTSCKGTSGLGLPTILWLVVLLLLWGFMLTILYLIQHRIKEEVPPQMSEVTQLMGVGHCLTTSQWVPVTKFKCGKFRCVFLSFIFTGENEF